MSVIQEKTYGDFSRMLHEQVIAQRIPAEVTIEVTRRCPLTCSHCYNNLPMDDFAARAGELTLDEHKRVLDELAEMGCLWLLFTGGEIFARRDFLDIYEHARRRGFIVTLFTNATLITEAIADRLAALPPFSIEVTLYGRTAPVYEALTGVRGSWARAMRGIELILDRKLPLKLKTVAVNVNLHELDAMKQYADELGVDFKFDAMINPRIDCSASPLETRLSPAQVVALDLGDPRRIEEFRRLGRECSPAPVADGETPQVYGCGGGVTAFALDPHGAMSICVLSHVDQYDIRSGSIRDGWEGFLHKVRTRPATRVTKCTGCSLRSMCGSCAANGELENGDAEAPVDFLCRTAHLRADVFGMAVAPHGDCEYCPGGTAHAAIEQMHHEVLRLATTPLAAPRTLGTVAAGCASGACGGCATANPNQ